MNNKTKPSEGNGHFEQCAGKRCSFDDEKIKPIFHEELGSPDPYSKPLDTKTAEHFRARFSKEHISVLNIKVLSDSDDTCLKIR